MDLDKNWLKVSKNISKIENKNRKIVGVLYLPWHFAGILWMIQYGKLLVGLNKRLSKVHKKKHMPGAL